MKLYGLTGKMRAGKDTFFAAVQASVPGARRLAFGDELKAEAAAACGVSVEYINQHKDTFRPLLQWWGTDFRRQLAGADYWVQRVAARLAQPEYATAPVVFITDVRFPNEAAFVTAQGGKVLRIVRLPAAVPPAPQAAHASEMAMEAIVADQCIAAESVAELQALAWLFAGHELTKK